MMNTELKKMKTEELELVTGCGLVVDLPDEKVKDYHAGRSHRRSARNLYGQGVRPPSDGSRGKIPLQLERSSNSSLRMNFVLVVFKS